VTYAVAVPVGRRVTVVGSVAAETEAPEGTVSGGVRPWVVRGAVPGIRERLAVRYKQS
jgi:hypothetical protein